MKIECDKCGAKYSIADEKVRGKTFKIRCKKCSNVIIVRDRAGGAAASGAEAEVPAPVGWHLAINGETVGPMSEDEVRKRFAAGELDRETAVWQEGFEDWLPIGDVEAFADLLTEMPAAAAEDPFASAHQEFAAARPLEAVAAAAPVARAAATAATTASEPSSPRVTRLTGQRNENSVLFSLDSLQALATGAPAAAAGRGVAQPRSGPKGLATQAPSSEGSGLIDIRALGAMVGSEAGSAPVFAPAKADDAALPSFGGANLGGLASAALIPTVHPIEHGAASPAMAASAPRSNAPLYAMMIVLLLLVVGLGAYIFLRPPEPTIVRETVPPEAPTAKVRGGDEKDEGKDAATGKSSAGTKDDPKDEAPPAESADDAGKVEAVEPEASKPASSKPASSKPKPSASSPKPTTAPTPKPTPATKPAGDNALDVECILDPNLPKCKGGGSKPASKPAGVDPSLPDALTSTEIKAGLAPFKDAAKACGAKHGATPGESVKVKLSISGATGTVTSAAAEPPHAGTPLGSCVAAALKRAAFKKFQKTSMGVFYPVKM